MALGRENTKTQKQALRVRVLEQRNLLSADVRCELSRQVMKNMFSLPEFSCAETVFFYVNFRSEVETLEGVKHALAESKTVAVPYCVLEERRLNFVQIKDVEKDLVEDAYGILEPKPSIRHNRRVPLERADVVLLPGSVFDLRGGRMGYGAGYYDKTFGGLRLKSTLIGLAFDFQVLPLGSLVPMADHDVFVGKIVTDKKVIDCKRELVSIYNHL
jgi:5-formyltetrahydrofolate cyclo-ligase